MVPNCPMERERMWWILLGFPGWGPVKIRQLVERTGCLKRAMHLVVKSHSNGAEIAKSRNELFDRTLALEQAWSCSIENKHYPIAWREYADSPLIFFGMGAFVQAQRSRHVGIVGTRSCSDHAVRLAFELGVELGRRKWTVVSGLAKGVDEAAHRGACYSGCRTIGVLGGPLRPLSPRSSRYLAGQMIRMGGSIITEHAIGEEVHPWHFASRNRLVVGLSEALIMVQSPKKGGALISAQLAIEMGIDCWVYRPSAREQSRRWEGNMNLLESFPEMGWSTSNELIERLINRSSAANPCLSESAIPESFRPIWKEMNALGKGHSSDISRSVNRPMELVESQLHQMELQGWVRRTPGGWYVPVYFGW